LRNKSNGVQPKVTKRYLISRGPQCCGPDLPRRNGVAILARWTPVLTRGELPGDPADTQSRYTEAAVWRNGAAARAVDIGQRKNVAHMPEPRYFLMASTVFGADVRGKRP